MFVQLNPTESGSVLTGPMPPILAPLFAAAARGVPLEQPVQSIVESFGFTNFILALSTCRTLRRDSKFYYCTTAPRQWVAEYDQHSCIEIDPRAIHSWNTLTPLIWDRRIGSGDPIRERFLARAAAYGVGSGICVGLRGDPSSHAMLALNCPLRDVDDATARKWTEMLGDITLLAIHFHAIFVRNVIDRGIEPLHHGAPLSVREKHCLLLSSKGQTSPDIAMKLSITERTVYFHFTNIMSKLGAATRQEAVAIGIARGIIDP